MLTNEEKQVIIEVLSKVTLPVEQAEKIVIPIIAKLKADLTTTKPLAEEMGVVQK